MIGFPSGTGVLLRSAARRLSRLVVSGAAVVAGRVDGLHDEDGSTDRWRVRVRGDLARSPRRAIWVRLPDQAAYDGAVEAYRTGREVRAAGELTSRDDRVELSAAVGEIEMVDEPEDDRAR